MIRDTLSILDLEVKALDFGVNPEAFQLTDPLSAAWTARS